MKPTDMEADRLAILTELDRQQHSRWIIDQLDVVADAGVALHAELSPTASANDVVETCRYAISRLFSFERTSFMWFTEDRLGIEVSDCVPPTAVDLMRIETDYQIAHGFLGWAINQNRAVTVPSSAEGKLTLIGALSTRSQTIGIFIGVTEELLIPDTILKTVSLVLLNCAHTLEASELYRKLAEQNQNLERMVAERTQALNQANIDLKLRNEELKRSLEEIDTLRGILPMCSYCKKVRDDAGYWGEVDRYISQHSEAQVSHGVCPTCMDKYFNEFSKG